LREVFQIKPPWLIGKLDLGPGYQRLLIHRSRKKDWSDEDAPEDGSRFGVPIAVDLLRASSLRPAAVH
jgi:hypothetical protein